LESDNKWLGEDKLIQLLSEFSCPLNPDVERFLKEQSLEFAKTITISRRWNGGICGSK
jgi:hypothetical protein